MGYTVLMNGEETTDFGGLIDHGGVMLLCDDEEGGPEGAYWLSELEVGVGESGTGYRISEEYMYLGCEWFDWEAIYGATGVARDDEDRAKVAYEVFKYYRSVGKLSGDVYEYADEKALRIGMADRGLSKFV